MFEQAFEMTEEEKQQLVGRFAHEFCDHIYKIMDEINHNVLLPFIEERGKLLGLKIVKLLNKPGKDGDGILHWTFAMADNFFYPDKDGKPTDKVVPMTLSFFGDMHVRANAQSILDCIVRLARGAGMTPMQLTGEIIHFMRDFKDPTEPIAPPVIDPPVAKPVVTDGPPKAGVKADPLAGVQTKK